MTKHEKLMAEYDDLYIEERQMINEGLYADEMCIRDSYYPIWPY